MKRGRRVLAVSGVVLGSVVVALAAAEIYLSHYGRPRAVIPFYNRLYPYVMFRPKENDAYVSTETFAMSHNRSRVYHYTNEDGLRVPAFGYKLVKEKPAGQLRVAVLGGSAVQMGSTYDVTLPGALKAVLRKRYPGRDVEVINAGIISCVSRQSIAHLLFTVLEYHPDVVVLYDGANDLGLPQTYESRPNFPYNFEVMQEAWEEYRGERSESALGLLLERSAVYRTIRAAVGEPAGPKLRTVTSEHILRSPEFVRAHVAAYLDNWRKLVELSEAYRYKPVCVLQATGGFDPSFNIPLLMKEYHLSRAAAFRWVKAYGVLCEEADRQIEGLRKEYPKGTFVNLRSFLSPPRRYFWDGVHVFDEVNLVIAERIWAEVQKREARSEKREE